ncbi:MAG: 3-deoxy-7-phosphoheptulonate synthase [Gammaproteobacteria bacterium]|nr:3-deoxy-7-phosphoheptulonate synthase [Gammaproteobacteria bacterium]
MRAVTENLNIESNERLITPDRLKAELPMSDAQSAAVNRARETVFSILRREDPRLFLVIGPCSVHDSEQALDYARRLKALADEVSDTLYLVMRVYFEKPRTAVGWKGMINDPYLDDSFQVEEGLRKGRRLLQDIVDIGLPTSTEALDPISPQYLQDLICWSAIGARTTESQTHREMSSGLSSAIGFKNGTDGGWMVAVNAMQSVLKPHRFLGINGKGQVSVVTTRGNPHAHIVLRGGSGGPNYDTVHIAQCELALEQGGVSRNIMIDCSHANSGKNPDMQPLVLKDIAHQILEGNNSIIGAMLESNIHGGRQDIPADLSQLKYGVSVTDACMGWETTEEAVLDMAAKLRDALRARANAKTKKSRGVSV